MPEATHRRAAVLALLLVSLAAFATRAGTSIATRATAAGSPQLVIVALDPNGPAPGTWSCLAGNPACARHDPWWQEALLEPPAAPGGGVEFSPLGPGFSADPRLAEAVLWLWTWPDGRPLLRQAAARGVSARMRVFSSGRGAVDAPARYDAHTRAVEIDARFAAAPSWLLGDVLAHELTHAAQDAAGQRLDSGPAACVATELPARRNEVAYARYLFDHLGTPPAGAEATLPATGQELYNMVTGLLGSSDLPRLVAGLCAMGGV